MPVAETLLKCRHGMQIAYWSLNVFHSAGFKPQITTSAVGVFA
jgi:hypothetical protein